MDHPLNLITHMSSQNASLGGEGDDELNKCSKEAASDVFLSLILWFTIFINLFEKTDDIYFIWFTVVIVLIVIVGEVSRKKDILNSTILIVLNTIQTNVLC